MNARGEIFDVLGVIWRANMSQSREEFQRQLDSEEHDEYYSLLNVDRQASPEDIRSAYRHLCLIYHPDRQVCSVPVLWGVPKMYIHFTYQCCM